MADLAEIFGPANEPADDETRRAGGPPDIVDDHMSGQSEFDDMDPVEVEDVHKNMLDLWPELDDGRGDEDSRNRRRRGNDDEEEDDIDTTERPPPPSKLNSIYEL